jgi:hypothetical protein
MSTLQMLSSAALIAASLAAAMPAFAAEMTAQQFADARLAAFGKGDTEALMAQYSDDATVFTPMGVLHGAAQIRPMIEGVIKEFAQPGVTFKMISQAAEGSTVAFVWQAETPKNVYDLGVETYVIADGKAVYQTLITKMKPK